MIKLDVNDAELLHGNPISGHETALGNLIGITALNADIFIASGWQIICFRPLMWLHESALDHARGCVECVLALIYFWEVFDLLFYSELYVIVFLQILTDSFELFTPDVANIDKGHLWIQEYLAIFAE